MKSFCCVFLRIKLSITRDTSGISTLSKNYCCYISEIALLQLDHFQKVDLCQKKLLMKQGNRQHTAFRYFCLKFLKPAVDFYNIKSGLITAERYFNFLPSNRHQR